MTRISLAVVAGARPNFMKIAPLLRELDGHAGRAGYRLIHTGQHTEAGMSGVFFDELGIPPPHVHLNCGGGTAAEQTAKMLIALEREFIDHRPDVVVVVGDVTSTLAAALAAKKLGLRLAHVEAGLRSGDRAMPEEINRLAVDAIADDFFVTEPSGAMALSREGHDDGRIHQVGNLMVDNLLYQIRRMTPAHADSFGSAALKHRLSDSGYGVVTLHRPANVDDPARARDIISALNDFSRSLPLVFPMHPRTRNSFERLGITLAETIHVLQPLSYMEFLNLWRDARIVLTDSGGLQEETTALGVRCVTLRDNTERPVTITDGTNLLGGTDYESIRRTIDRSMASAPTDRRPPLWDGHAAARIVAALLAGSPLHLGTPATS